MAANATAVWRVRPSGNNNNGGGYDAGIASAGTDFSQQNAAQVTQSGGTVSTATTTLTDTGASFTSALIGNAIRVAGTGITTTYTFITAVPTGTTLTLQTSPGTTGTTVTFSIGGGWADPFTNTLTTGFLVPGNTVYILGSGTPNPAAYTVDYSVATGSTVNLKTGDTTTGNIRYLNDPNTPGYKAPPDTTGGMPTLNIGTNTNLNNSYCDFSGVYFLMSSGGGSGRVLYPFNNPNTCIVFGCVFDLRNHSSSSAIFSDNGGQVTVLGCEVFDSVGGATASAITLDANEIIAGCNLHDVVAVGIQLSNGSAINNIIAKCAGDGIQLLSNRGNRRVVANNTIDGNTGHGITIATPNDIQLAAIYNNIISNHTTGGKAGINITSGTAAANDLLKGFIDYNSFYNNAANYSGISAGAHDTASGASPYVASSTENYTLV